MPCSVLVVDDDEAIRSALCEILELEGYTVRGVANGREALQEVERHCPELVLLDMQMPIMDGWAFARAARERGITVTILVLTAAMNAERWASEIQADGWISKPFDLDQLFTEVERLCPPQHMPHAA